MKSRWFSVAIVAAASLFVPGIALAGEGTEGLTGIWNVVAKPGAINTCGDAAENTAYQWILTQNGATVAVVVQGNTSFPRLTGAISAKRLALDGTSVSPLGSGLAGVFASSVFHLEVSGKKFKGKRYYLGSRARPEGGTAVCMTEFEVSGSKQ